MFIYNSVINSFIKEQEETLYSLKINIPQLRNLKILVHESHKNLGLYHQGKDMISLDKSLLYMADKETVREILLHELAHHLVYHRHGSTVEAHGKEFKEFCQKLEIPAKATLDIRKKLEESKDRSLLEKIQKLLRLGSSSNSNESEAALLKANELLIKNNLKHHKEDTDQVYMSPVLTSSQIRSKQKAISRILDTFNVFCVWSENPEVYCTRTYRKIKGRTKTLQISGDRTSVEIASWVGSFLEEELERMWLRAKKENNLKGSVAKNCFLLGVAAGYRDKVDQVNVQYGKELMVVNDQHKKLAKKYIYNKLRTSSSKGRKSDPEGFLAGKKAGTSLSFNKPIQDKTGKVKLLK